MGVWGYGGMGVPNLPNPSMSTSRSTSTNRTVIPEGRTPAAVPPPYSHTPILPYPRLGLLLAATACLAGCGHPGKNATPGASSGPPFAFQNLQPGSGLSFRLGPAAGQKVGIKETSGHAAALLDADGDGLLDILL